MLFLLNLATEDQLAVAARLLRTDHDRRDLPLAHKPFALFKSCTRPHHFADGGCELPAQLPGWRISARLSGRYSQASSSSPALYADKPCCLTVSMSMSVYLMWVFI